VGVGIPGFILMEKGVVVGAPNLPEFDNYPVRDEIEKRLGARVILENDANAAALGEKWRGAGRDVEDLVLMTLGTGIGGGIIIGGRVLHGHLGMAADFALADMRDFDPAGISPVDLAYVLLGSIYVGSNREFLGHLDRVAQTLAPGGLYLLDSVVWFEIFRGYRRRWTRHRGSGGKAVRVRGSAGRCERS